VFEKTSELRLTREISNPAYSKAYYRYVTSSGTITDPLSGRSHEVGSSHIGRQSFRASTHAGRNSKRRRSPRARSVTLACVPAPEKARTEANRTTVIGQARWRRPEKTGNRNAVRRLSLLAGANLPPAVRAGQRLHGRNDLNNVLDPSDKLHTSLRRSDHKCPTLQHRDELASRLRPVA
jgi:hypothetical protein